MFDHLGSVRTDFFIRYINSYIFLTSNLISVLGALCYAEIGTLLPRNGAEIVYLKEGIFNESFHLAFVYGTLFCSINNEEDD